jgi:hypothetical protein
MRAMLIMPRWSSAARCRVQVTSNVRHHTYMRWSAKWFAGLLVAALVVWNDDSLSGAWHHFNPPAPVASQVPGFSLLQSNFTAQASPLFDLGYATNSTYEYVSHQGETIVPVGTSTYVAFPGTKPSRYAVLETLIDITSEGRTKRSRLAIVDTLQNKEIASRVLRDRQVEGGTGWTGDHAYQFIKAALPQPPRPRRHRWVDQVIAQSLLSVLPLAPIHTEQFTYSTHGCGSNVYIRKMPSQNNFQSLDWRFQTLGSINGAFCSGQVVVIVSNIYPNNPVVNVLKRDGTHIGTFELVVPGNLLSEGAVLANVDRGSVEGQLIQFQVHYVTRFQDEYLTNWRPHQRYEIQLRVPELQ